MEIEFCKLFVDEKDENSGLVFKYPAVTGAADSFGKSLIVSVTCDLAAPSGSATQFTVVSVTETAVNVVGTSSSGSNFLMKSIN